MTTGPGRRRGPGRAWRLGRQELRPSHRAAPAGARLQGATRKRNAASSWGDACERPSSEFRPREGSAAERFETRTDSEGARRGGIVEGPQASRGPSAVRLPPLQAASREPPLDAERALFWGIMFASKCMQGTRQLEGFRVRDTAGPAPGTAHIRVCGMRGAFPALPGKLRIRVRPGHGPTKEWSFRSLSLSLSLYLPRFSLTDPCDFDSCYLRDFQVWTTFRSQASSNRNEWISSLSVGSEPSEPGQTAEPSRARCRWCPTMD